MSLKLRSLTLRGFRAYGANEQTLNLPTDLAAVWGPNSKGKTSLAEAIEFLSTGQISRRELMASAQDEFADSLRNAHLADGEDVVVSASIEDCDGAIHAVQRVLRKDYSKKEHCESELTINGAAADEAALTSLGVVVPM